jgi:hypothetical protein
MQPRCRFLFPLSILTILLIALAGRAVPFVESSEHSKQSKPSAVDSRIEELIRQLGSMSFAERDRATKSLEEIGEVALDALRDAAKKSPDPEIRRRAGQLAERLDAQALSTLFKEGVAQEAEKNFKKAAVTFDLLIRKSLEKYHSGGRSPAGDIPFLTEIYLHSAHISQQLGDFVKAANAFGGATYYANFNNQKRQQI